jgi:hypothetical protein
MINSQRMGDRTGTLPDTMRMSGATTRQIPGSKRLSTVSQELQRTKVQMPDVEVTPWEDKQGTQADSPSHLSTTSNRSLGSRSQRSTHSGSANSKLGEWVTRGAWTDACSARLSDTLVRDARTGDLLSTPAIHLGVAPDDASVVSTSSAGEESLGLGEGTRGE